MGKKTDRKLLELAAKVAGIEGEWFVPMRGILRNGGEEMSTHFADDATLAHIAELERQLAEANVEIARLNSWADRITNAILKERAAADEYIKELRKRAEQAEQRILESQRQEPYAFVIPGGDNVRDNLWLDCHLTDFGECTKPLYDMPIIPPEVEEAVKAEREAIAELAIKWGNAREDDYGGHALRKFASATRERGEK